ncbi:MAG: 16S rRNA processing protein RimM [Clostridia bacterium]|nr:16S rRNA processing protein RimM [Clostridia bacterium]
MIKKYLQAGQIVSTHGVRGEVRFQPWCDSADFLKKFKKLYTDEDGSGSFDILSVREHGNVAIMKIRGVDCVDDALRLKGTVLYIKRADAKLPKGSYFIAELIGCTVVDDDDETLVYGVISDVSQTGANDVWHIEKDSKEYLIPAIPDVLRSVDVEKGVVSIKALKGIFDDEN